MFFNIDCLVYMTILKNSLRMIYITNCIDVINKKIITCMVII